MAWWLNLDSLTNAFAKGCAPVVTPIGPYSLISECDLPPPPNPIITPVEPIIPIPPIDQGCYPFSVTGEFHGPGPETPPGGSVGVSMTYPTGDVCEPEVKIDIFVPCLVAFTQAYVDVAYDPFASNAATNVIPIDENCSLGFSLDMILPCPTDLVGTTGTVRFSPGDAGSMIVNGSKVPGTCDLALSLEAILPCPGFVTAKGVYEDFRESSSGEPKYCILPARRPVFSVIATNPVISSSSSVIPTCNTQLDFVLQMPCPIVWKPGQLNLTRTREFGLPSGEFKINEGSSSTCTQDCNPQLAIDLTIPCPVLFNVGNSSSGADIDFGGSNFAWAHTPSAKINIDFGNIESSRDQCAPVFSLDMVLPCPVEVKVSQSSSDNVNQFDPTYWMGALAENTESPRRWAFGQPTANLKVSRGRNDQGQETFCVPVLDLDLNLPCPTGGVHKDLEAAPPDQNSPEYFAWEQASLVRDKRNQDYVDKYGTVDASLHPYWNKLPNADVTINRNLSYFAQPNKSQFAGLASGNFTGLEFNENCELSLGLSLYIPCGKRAPDVKFFDISDFGNPQKTELPDSEFRAEVAQDWTDGPDAEDCAFDDTVELYVTRGGGGRAKFAIITDKIGIAPPYIYSAVEANMDNVGAWNSLQNGAEYSNNVWNMEEQGGGGQFVNPLLAGDAVVIYPNNDNTAWVAQRAHYRGTY